MKRSMTVAMLSLFFCGIALQAQNAGPAAWVGVWNGTLEGQPGVVLTLAEDHGRLGGTIVFNVILGQPPHAHVGKSDVLLVTHPRLEGDTFSFQVTRKNGAKPLQMAVKSIDSDRLQFQCPDCGGGPMTTLVKSQP